MAGTGSSTHSFADDAMVATNLEASDRVKNAFFHVIKYAPVKKSCVAEIMSSPFLGVTKLASF